MMMTDGEKQVREYLSTKVHDVDTYIKYVGTAFGDSYPRALSKIMRDIGKSLNEGWLIILEQERNKWEPRCTSNGGTGRYWEGEI